MPTVLLVDDDDAMRKVLYTVFELASGFDACMEARDGFEAIHMIRESMPNLAVVDFSMPDMNGLQLAQELKTLAPQLPIFMLTTEIDSAIEKEALSCGIIAVFSKFDDLGSLVANARAVCGIE